MSKQRLFSPPRVQIVEMPTELADRRDGSVYVYTERIELAVNVAVATGRPLLLRGPSGCGKSTLAPATARFLGWRYYEEVISSHTKARDLLWRFDALRRLSDAQVNKLADNSAAYLEPGVLWWAFDRGSARGRGLIQDGNPRVPAASEPGEARSHDRAVVLLDEIDKADPDVPNNLLVPLGCMEFFVEETGTRVKARQPPLVIITTNDERELPKAFLRRCVVLNLPVPDRERLLAIAGAHFGSGHRDLCEEIARHVYETQPPSAGRGTAPSTAEYLDTVRACLEMEAKPGSADWEGIARITLWKETRHGDAS